MENEPKTFTFLGREFKPLDEAFERNFRSAFCDAQPGDLYWAEETPGEGLISTVAFLSEGSIYEYTIYADANGDWTSFIQEAKVGVRNQT